MMLLFEQSPPSATTAVGKPSSSSSAAGPQSDAEGEQQQSISSPQHEQLAVESDTGRKATGADSCGEPITSTAIRETGDKDEEEERDEQQLQSKCRCEEGVSLSAMFHDITVFRDFFLAAFSDGNNSTAWCGEEGFCCDSPSSKAVGVAKVAPLDEEQQRQQQQPLSKTRSSASSYAEASAANGSTSSSLQKSPSHDSRPPLQGRRKKPLAVAVGFNYAEDPSGRPIVITPTTTTTNASSSTLSVTPSVATAVTANTLPLAPQQQPTTVMTGTKNAPIDLTHVGAVAAPLPRSPPRRLTQSHPPSGGPATATALPPNDIPASTGYVDPEVDYHNNQAAACAASAVHNNLSL